MKLSISTLVLALLPSIHAQTAMRLDREIREELEARIVPAVLPNLFTVELPAGDVPGLDLDWLQHDGSPRYDPQSWLARGYDGVRFVGKGVDVTHMRSTRWGGITVAVRRHNGIVQLENMTVHAGFDRGTAFGEQNFDGDRDAQGKLLEGTQRITAPKFELRLVNVKGVVDPPPSYGASAATIVTGGAGYRNGELVTVVGGEGRPTKIRISTSRSSSGGDAAAALTIEPGENGAYSVAPPDTAQVSGGSGSGLTVRLSWRRAKWMWFAYQADLYARDVETDATEAVEHAYYWHGFASRGVDMARCDTASGAEGFKVRSDQTETAWAGPSTVIAIRDSRFGPWHFAHSWRGGAAVVIQGGASHVVVERCTFYAGEAIPNVSWNERSHAVMISSEAKSYDQGSRDSGFGNGYVVIRQCAAVGGSEVAWSNAIMRCGRNGGSQFSARGYLLEGSGLWGPRLVIQLAEIPSGKVAIRGCNTPELADYCRDFLGMEPSPEVTFPTAQRLVPLSEGIVR